MILSTIVIREPAYFLERQLRLCGHVTRLSTEDPVHRILSCRDPSDWTMPRAWRLSGRWPDGGLSEGYEHGGPGVCLGDGQTESI